jgi:uridine phosphorylase
MEHATPHHLTIGPEHCAGNERFGRLFLLPGSDGRARQIADHFTDLQVVPSPRQHNAYLGRLAGRDGFLDVGTVATGMGCPSVDIIVTELVTSAPASSCGWAPRARCSRRRSASATW